VNQEGLKLNGTKRPFSYADDVDKVGENIDTINKNTEPLLRASKEVRLQATPEN
jgi:hypothetical protein